MKVTNKHAYKFGPHTKFIEITVKVALDMVPGWGDCPDDHIDKMFENRYVVEASMNETED